MKEIPGWSDHICTAVLRKYCKDKIVLEIGNFCGRSSVEIGKVGKFLYTIDPHIAEQHTPERVYKPQESLLLLYNNIVEENLEGKVFPITMKSEEVLKWWRKKVDVVFVDGDHTYEGAKKDCGWRKFLSIGGYMIWHDYHKTHPDVIRVIEEEIRPKMNFVELAFQTIVFEKKNEEKYGSDSMPDRV